MSADIALTGSDAKNGVVNCAEAQNVQIKSHGNDSSITFTVKGTDAAGNASNGVMGRSYAGAGSTIGPAMTFAYVALWYAVPVNIIACLHIVDMPPDGVHSMTNYLRLQNHRQTLQTTWDIPPNN